MMSGCLIPTLDLFSGCGGITHALRDIATPVMYCEKDPVPRRVLEALMERGALPRAPVHEDVCTLQGHPLKGKVRMIVGGFPCVGVSTAGLREGLAHPGTGLFREVVRLASEIQPDYLFLENVAAIVEPRHSSPTTILEDVVTALSALGYAMQWVVLPAFQVGSPQIRKRWFALCYRRAGERLHFPSWAPFHSATTEPAVRMVEPSGDAVRRARILGNSVVPCCVALAFRMLWSGCTTTIGQFEAHDAALTPAAPLERARTKHFGCAVDGVPRACAKPTGLVPKPDLRIVLDPTAYDAGEGYEAPRNARPKSEPYSIPVWPSPRHLNGWRGAKTLTWRGRGDLGTAVRFATSTAGDREGFTNPEFIEWLMGYPSGWTDHTTGPAPTS